MLVSLNNNEKYILLILFTLFSICNSLDAQLCFKEFRPQECQTQLILEYGLAYPIKLSDSSNRGLTYAFYNIGVSRNINDKFGLGAFAFFNVFQCSTQFGLKPRISYFPNDNIELNFSPGIILARGDQEQERDQFDLPALNFEASVYNASN